LPAAVGTDVERLAGQLLVALTVALGRQRFGRRGRKQGAAEREFLGAVAIGEEAEVADAVEPVLSTGVEN
jgi:hypothetical protein